MFYVSFIVATKKNIFSRYTNIRKNESKHTTTKINQTQERQQERKKQKSYKTFRKQLTNGNSESLLSIINLKINRLTSPLKHRVTK